MPHTARRDLAPHTARRRAALSAAFAGRPVVVPAGSLKVRANDTDYPFRPAGSFTWLTGETEADAVLVLAPRGDTHEATLYVREFAQAGDVEYFTSRTHGAVWVGNVPSVADTADVLGITTRPLAALARRPGARTATSRSPCCTASTRPSTPCWPRARAANSSRPSTSCAW